VPIRCNGSSSPTPSKSLTPEKRHCLLCVCGVLFLPRFWVAFLRCLRLGEQGMERVENWKEFLDFEKALLEFTYKSGPFAQHGLMTLRLLASLGDCSKSCGYVVMFA